MISVSGATSKLRWNDISVSVVTSRLGWDDFSVRGSYRDLAGGGRFGGSSMKTTSQIFTISCMDPATNFL